MKRIREIQRSEMGEKKSFEEKKRWKMGKRDEP